MPKLGFETCGPFAGGEPEHMVVLLHGVDSNGTIMRAMVDAFQEEIEEFLPNALFVMPHGIYAAQDEPSARLWYTTPGNGQGGFDDMATLMNILNTAGILNGFIDEQLEARGMDDSQLAIMGASQGAVMGMYAAYQREKPCAAVVSHSGYYPGVASPKSRPMTLLLHGDHDPFIEGSVPLVEASDIETQMVSLPEVAQEIPVFDPMVYTGKKLDMAGVANGSIKVEGLGHAISQDSMFYAAEFMAEGFKIARDAAPVVEAEPAPKVAPDRSGPAS